MHPRFAAAGRRFCAEIASWSAALKTGTGLMAAIVLAGRLAPLDLALRSLLPGLRRRPAAAEPAHPFGTDSLGRDIFSRVLYGIRIDLPIGVIPTYVPMAYGVVLGAFSGYIGGRFDAAGHARPRRRHGLSLPGADHRHLAILGPGVQNIYIAIFLVAWTMYARLARAEMIVERTKDYVTAARVLGFPLGRIVFRHGLPNVINSSIVFSACRTSCSTSCWSRA